MREKDYQAEIDELRSEVKQLTKQLKRTTGRAAGELSDKAEEYMKTAHDYYDDLSGRAKEEWERVREGAKVKGKELDQYAHEKPWQTAGIAAAIGFAAALLMSSKRDRR